MFCTDSCSLVFGTTELKHVTVQSFDFHLTEELQTEALELSRFSLRFFLSQALSWLTDHCGALLVTESTMATVPATAAGTNTGSAWRTEQHSAVTDKALSEFSLERYNMLMTNTLRVNQLAYETVSTAENLAPHTG